MQVPSYCPYCGDAIWVDIVNKEDTVFPYECPQCEYTIEVSVRWKPDVSVEVYAEEVTRKAQTEAGLEPDGHF